MLRGYDPEFCEKKQQKKQNQEHINLGEDFPDVFWCESCNNLIDKQIDQNHVQTCKYQLIKCENCGIEILKAIYEKHLNDCNIKNGQNIKKYHHKKQIQSNNNNYQDQHELFFENSNDKQHNKTRNIQYQNDNEYIKKNCDFDNLQNNQKLDYEDFDGNQQKFKKEDYHHRHKIDQQIMWDDFEKAQKKQMEQIKLEDKFMQKLSISEQINKIERIQKQGFDLEENKEYFTQNQKRKQQQQKPRQNNYFQEEQFTENETINMVPRNQMRQMFKDMVEKEKEIIQQQRLEQEIQRNQQKSEEQIWIENQIRKDKEKELQRMKEKEAVYFYEAKNFDKTLTCSICLVNFELSEKTAILSCLHKYHPDCIKSWMKQKKQCPYCKNEILPM